MIKSATHTMTENRGSIQDWAALYLSTILAIEFGVVVTVGFIYLGVTDIIPEWIASLAALAGWCYVGEQCWRWESHIASGVRGRYINPYGNDGDMVLMFNWFFFGIFLMFFNIVVRKLHRMLD